MDNDKMIFLEKVCKNYKCITDCYKTDALIDGCYLYFKFKKFYKKNRNLEKDIDDICKRFLKIENQKVKGDK